MAESKPLDKSMTKCSNILPDIYCDPCYDVEGKIIQTAGFCKDCSEALCKDCISAHKKQKMLRNHEIQDKTVVSHEMASTKEVNPVTETCHLHQGEVIQSYCKSCDQLCCKICRTIDHQACDMQSLTNAAANIKDSEQVKKVENKLKELKKGYNDNLIKSEKQSLDIENMFTDSIKEIRMLQEKFEKLLAVAKRQAETVKDTHLKKMESISTTCNILDEQVNKIYSNLDEMKDNTDNETYFILIKRAESQLQSIEGQLNKLDTDNTIKENTFKPEEKLNAMLDELMMLEKLSLSDSTSSAPMPMLKTAVSAPLPMLKTAVSAPKPMLKTAVSAPMPMLKTAVSAPMPMLKTAVHIKDIDIDCDKIRGSIILPNQRLLITDHDNKVKLINTKRNKIVSELHLPDKPWDVTQVEVNTVAITCPRAQKIQFVSVSSDKLSMGREMSVNGQCYGIAYNAPDYTLIVTCKNPPNVEILSLTGSVIKLFDKDYNGDPLFSCLYYVALSHKTKMYVSDYSQHSVTLMTLNGKVKAVYKDKELDGPRGVHVNRSGVVHVVGRNSKTVHQIVPGRDKIEPLLDEEDGLDDPSTVTYCDVENRLYVGQHDDDELQVFKIK